MPASEIDLAGGDAYVIGLISTTSAMALRTIITLPDKRLHKRAAAVASVDAEVGALMDDLLETMYAAPGIGLAATQIGVMKRVMVLDIAKRQDETASPDPMVFANPEILWASEETSAHDEGCLSIPEFFEEVVRPTRIRVAYLDRSGKRQEIEADGILARCLQHEIDHLNGVLFIDHISRLKRERILKKFSKAAKRDTEERKPGGHEAEAERA
jgi:peptide deformylase